MRFHQVRETERERVWSETQKWRKNRYFWCKTLFLELKLIEIYIFIHYHFYLWQNWSKAIGFLLTTTTVTIDLLCSWDKSLNIWSRMLQIFLKVTSFTFDSLNCMQLIRSYSFYILVIGQKSFIFLMMCWIIWLSVSKRIKEKGLSWKVSRSTK